MHGIAVLTMESNFGTEALEIILQQIWWGSKVLNFPSASLLPFPPASLPQLFFPLNHCMSFSSSCSSFLSLLLPLNTPSKKNPPKPSFREPLLDPPCSSSLLFLPSSSRLSFPGLKKLPFQTPLLPPPPVDSSCRLPDKVLYHSLDDSTIQLEMAKMILYMCKPPVGVMARGRCSHGGSILTNLSGSGSGGEPHVSSCDAQGHLALHCLIGTPSVRQAQLLRLRPIRISVRNDESLVVAREVEKRLVRA